MTALSKFKILELSESPSGEYCGKLLSDFGADVIKIERPGTGSPTRSLGPFAGSGKDPERSGLFAYLNTNKNSVVLDLYEEAGRETVAKLLAYVDVVIDDHPPGWLKGIGLDPASVEQEYPSLILVSITAYGQNPPEERRYAEDLTIYHSSVWGFHTPGGGYDDKPPLNGPGRFFVSYEAGIEAAMCTAAALYDREDSGRGRFIDIAKNMVMTSRADFLVSQFLAGELNVSMDRGAFDLAGPSRIIPCKNGYVYTWMSHPMHWDALKVLLGSPDWMEEFPDRWLELAPTPERVAKIRHHLGQWLADKGREEASAMAQELGLVMCPVYAAKDVYGSQQYRHRKFFAEVSNPVMGTALYPTVPYKMSETPAQIMSPSPLLGEHTASRLATIAEGDAKTPGGR